MAANRKKPDAVALRTIEASILITQAVRNLDADFIPNIIAIFLRVLLAGGCMSSGDTASDRREDLNVDA